MSIRTKPSTDEYRENWDRIFGRPARVYDGIPCAACGTATGIKGPIHESERAFHSWCLGASEPVDAPLEAEVARLAADSPPSSDGWAVPENALTFVHNGNHWLPKDVVEKLRAFVRNDEEARRRTVERLEVHGAKPDAIRKPGTGE